MICVYDRCDIIETEQGKYAVKTEDNTIPGSVDVRVVEYEERQFLENDFVDAGEVEAVDMSSLEEDRWNTYRECVESTYGEDQGSQENVEKLLVEGVENL